MIDNPQILTREDGTFIAYHKTEGCLPGIIFFTGFRSDMEGNKALALEEFCHTRGQAFLRFDYTGHGASSGNFIDGCIGDWIKDALYVLDHLTTGPQILVGSSMGGWIMLHAALARPKRIAGLIGIAAAPDFTADLIADKLTTEQKAVLACDGYVNLENPYDDNPTPISQKLIDDGKKHLLLHKQISLDMPVYLLHGQQDLDVPWQTTLRTASMLQSENVEIILIKNGDHPLSMNSDIIRLKRVTATLLDQIETA